MIDIVDMIVTGVLDTPAERKDQNMQTWRCTIEWDIEAESPEEAAALAWESVINSTGPVVAVRPADSDNPHDEIDVDLTEGLSYR